MFTCVDRSKDVKSDGREPFPRRKTYTSESREGRERHGREGGRVSVIVKTNERRVKDVEEDTKFYVG